VSARLLMMASLLLMGCPSKEAPKRVEIYATTTTPPARTARITNTDTTHYLEISRGVAIGITSWTTCPNAPVTALTPADPKVLGAHTVYRNGQPNQFVIFGQQVGVTTLLVSNGCAQQRYEVTVLGL
jgi:hypothetical protein